MHLLVEVAEVVESDDGTWINSEIVVHFMISLCIHNQFWISLTEPSPFDREI